VDVPGLQPAASPSATNLAAAGTPASGGISLPASSPAMIANAPLADYLSTKAAPDKLTAPGVTNTNSAASLLAAGTTTPGAGMAPQLAGSAAAPNGPYDPNSYKPSSTTMTAAASSTTSTAADRYGVTPIDAMGPAPAENATSIAQQVPNAAPATMAPVGDRYGFASASAAAPQTNATSFSATASTNPTATVATLTASATLPPTATMQTTTLGQYRPGGTSSYIGSLPAQNMAVAARPAPPATTPTTSTVAPSGGAIPWAPAGTTTAPTQRY